MTLERFLTLIEHLTPLRANMDDLAGISSGFSDLTLGPGHRMHDTPLCQLAKSRPKTDHRCRVCKVAANRRAARGTGAVEGTCYLGISDWVARVDLGGQLVAVVYLGSVRILETLDHDRERLLRACRQHDLDPDAALAAWEAVPAVPRQTFEAGHESVLAICEYLETLMRQSGLGVLSFRPDFESHLTGRYHRLSPHIEKALHIMQTELESPLRAHDLCRRLSCSPGHFSRTFHEEIGMPYSECLIRMRIARGRLLLRRTNLLVSEIAAMTGFSDQTHFGRVFRKSAGMTPREFRRVDP